MKSLALRPITDALIITKRQLQQLTDMGGPYAPLSVEEGADTAIWLATRDFDPSVDQTGFLWEEREVIPW